MRSAIIAFVLGAAFLQQQASLLQWEYLGLLLAAVLLLFFSSLKFAKLNAYVGLALRAICFAIAGFVWASVYAHAYLAQELPAEWEGRDVAVIGTIDSLPHQFPQGVRFNFAVEQILAQGRTVPVLPSKLSLSWYSSFGSQEFGPIGDVKPGERWQFTVRLKRPHGNANEYVLTCLLTLTGLYMFLLMDKLSRFVAGYGGALAPIKTKAFGSRFAIFAAITFENLLPCSRHAKPILIFFK